MWRGRVFNWGCQAGGRVCWAPRDLFISLHVYSLKNKLCRLHFLRVLVAMWTCGDFCLAFSPPSLRVTSKLGSDQRHLKKINSPTYQHPAYMHTAPCLDTTYSLTQKRKASDTVWCFSFSFFCVSSSTVLSNIATFQLIFLFSHMCVFYFST